MREDGKLRQRSARHAALGDPVRLAIIDELVSSDRAPGELRRLVGVESNLLAHHLDVLDDVGLIHRWRSSGDGRRRYVGLVPSALEGLEFGRSVPIGPALFICSANSARSQLAAALWREIADAPADSAGTRPAERVHPGAIAAARRAGVELTGAAPRELAADERFPGLVVTVCDQAHEELEGPAAWLHWSIPDPVPLGTRAAFDAAVAGIRTHIESILHDQELAS